MLLLLVRDKTARLISLSVYQRPELLQVDLSVAVLVALFDHCLNLIHVYIQTHALEIRLHLFFGKISVAVDIE